MYSLITKTGPVDGTELCSSCIKDAETRDLVRELVEDERLAEGGAFVWDGNSTAACTGC